MEKEQLQDFTPFLTRYSVTKLRNNKVKNQDNNSKSF